jgi:hypothetical protein
MANTIQGTVFFIYSTFLPLLLAIVNFKVISFFSRNAKDGYESDSTLAYRYNHSLFFSQIALLSTTHTYKDLLRLKSVLRSRSRIFLRKAQCLVLQLEI